MPSTLIESIRSKKRDDGNLSSSASGVLDSGTEFEIFESLLKGDASKDMEKIQNENHVKEARHWKFGARWRRKTPHESCTEEEKFILHKKLKSTSKYSKIRSIVISHPDSLTSFNEYGQTAFHIAASRAVAPDILCLIYDLYPEACSVQDSKGRYPLHYISERCKDIVDTFYCGKANESCEELIINLTRSMLCSFPPALTAEDINNQTPVQCAEQHDAPFAFVDLLHRFANLSSQEEFIDKFSGIDVVTSYSDNKTRSKKERTPDINVLPSPNSLKHDLPGLARGLDQVHDRSRLSLLARGA